MNFLSRLELVSFLFWKKYDDLLGAVQRIQAYLQDPTFPKAQNLILTVKVDFSYTKTSSRKLKCSFFSGSEQQLLAQGYYSEGLICRSLDLCWDAHYHRDPVGRHSVFLHQVRQRQGRQQGPGSGPSPGRDGESALHRGVPMASRNDCQPPARGRGTPAASRACGHGHLPAPTSEKFISNFNKPVRSG